MALAIVGRRDSDKKRLTTPTQATRGRQRGQQRKNKKQQRRTAETPSPSALEAIREPERPLFNTNRLVLEQASSEALALVEPRCGLWLPWFHSQSEPLWTPLPPAYWDFLLLFFLCDDEPVPVRALPVDSATPSFKSGVPGRGGD
uniref:Uncharacterized protein n=1 Tax=Rhizochromulina marina TaxID=1034831 RepID=A0A7S2RF18_9STRA